MHKNKFSMIEIAWLHTIIVDYLHVKNELDKKQREILAQAAEIILKKMEINSNEYK